MSVNRSSAKFTGPRRDVYLALCLDLIVKLYRIFVSFSWSSYLTYVLCSILDWTILGFSAAYFCHINLIDVPDDCFIDLNDVIWKSKEVFEFHWKFIYPTISGFLNKANAICPTYEVDKNVKKKFAHTIKVLSMSMIVKMGFVRRASAEILVQDAGRSIN